jgi:ketosteroid isomerase-like protein
VKRGYAAFNNADIETLTELIAEDATQHMVGDNLVSGEYKGRDAIFAMYARLGELTNGTYRADIEQIFTDGEGTVVVVHRQTAQRNGKQLDNRQALIFTILDGVVVDLQDTSDDIANDDAFYQ